MPEQQTEDKIRSAVRAFAESVNSGGRVVADMSPLVRATSNLPLSRLDYWERLIRWEFADALAASIPPKWKLWARQRRLPTWIDLSAGDGFMRERTLRTLSGAAPNRFFFALATRRLNDWVPEVRAAARQQLPVIARQSDPSHVTDVLCITLPHWTSWGRMEEADKQVILQIAAVKQVAAALQARIISGTAGPLTSVLAQTGRTDLFDRELPEIARAAVQPSVRAKAYRSLLQAKAVWFEGRKWGWSDKLYTEWRSRPVVGERRIRVERPFIDILKQAAADPSPMVRRVAGEMLIRELNHIGEESLVLAKRLASDPSPSVAERGEFVLQKLQAKAR